jgi:hypothetical protein
MDLQELTQELIEFLNSTGQFQSFLDWEEERGYDRDELENNMEKAEEGLL